MLNRLRPAAQLLVEVRHRWQRCIWTHIIVPVGTKHNFSLPTVRVFCLFSRSRVRPILRRRKPVPISLRFSKLQAEQASGALGIQGLRTIVSAVDASRHGSAGVASLASTPPPPPPGGTPQWTATDTFKSKSVPRLWRSFNTSASVREEDSVERMDRVSFPPASAGGIILGPLQLSDESRAHERIRKIIHARAFDDFFQDGVERTGRKQLSRAMKGDFIGDYYMDKITDPLMTNPDGKEEAAIRAERNARGFKRRRPQKKVKKGK